MINEIWLQVIGFEDYHVSNLGRVKSFKCKKEKILNKNNSPRYVVTLCREKIKLLRYDYVLVYETFSGDVVVKGECIHHKNENITDNRFENLEKMTKSDHHKLHNTGIKNPAKREDSRLKNSRSHIGIKHSDKTKQKQSLCKLGYRNPSSKMYKIRKKLIQTLISRREKG